MDEIKTEKWTLEDGRRAERRVVDTVGASGEAERIIELHVEDERPLRLQQRVVEKRKPIVYEREIHTVDSTGNVTEKKVESVEPRTPMQVVEHIANFASPDVTAQAVEEDCDCHVTKEEMIETIIAAIKAAKEEIAVPHVDVPAAPESQGLVDAIENRAKQMTSGFSAYLTMPNVLIAGAAAALAYVLFWM